MAIYSCRNFKNLRFDRAEHFFNCRFKLATIMAMISDTDFHENTLKLLCRIFEIYV